MSSKQWMSRNIPRAVVAALAATALLTGLSPLALENPVAEARQDAPTVTVTAPATIKQELTVWDVAFNSANGRVDPSTPAHTATVSAVVAAPASGAVSDVRAVPTGPGTFTPLSQTQWDSIAKDQQVKVTWRWSAPLRSLDPPDQLQLGVQVSYAHPSGQRIATEQATVATPPPPAPTHDAYVSDLPFNFATNGYGPPERDKNNGELRGGDGGPLRLDGVTYPKGLGFNARAAVGIHLGTACARFTARVGIDDGKGNAGSVVYQVVADGKVLFDSGRMTGATPAKAVDLDVTDVRKLTLVTDPTADGQGNDWADWAAAHVTCGPLIPARAISQVVTVRQQAG